MDNPYPYNYAQEVQYHTDYSEFIPQNRNKPRLDFPKFNGENPRGWIRKSTKYLIFNNKSDSDKLNLAA